MTDLRQAAQIALEALEEFKRRWWVVPPFGNKVNKATREAITNAHSPISQLENALRAALAEQSQQEPVKFLANGTRFKMSFFQNEDGEGNTVPGTHVTCFEAFEDELDGRWVALVPAEDDCHLNAAPTPPAPAVEGETK